VFTSEQMHPLLIPYHAHCEPDDNTKVLEKIMGRCPRGDQRKVGEFRTTRQPRP
jgi:hypothetical protein